MTQPTTTKVTPITAGELVPGDVVVTITGERLYAAFDVDHDPRTGVTTIWTSVRDQDSGYPRRQTIESTATIHAAR